jgi:hypothetical protein
VLVLVDNEGFCFCNCADVCCLGHIGSTKRCTQEELRKQGHKVISLDKKGSKAIHQYYIGKKSKIKIR